MSEDFENWYNDEIPQFLKNIVDTFEKIRSTTAKRGDWKGYCRVCGRAYWIY